MPDAIRVWKPVKVVAHSVIVCRLLDSGLLKILEAVVVEVVHLVPR